MNRYVGLLLLTGSLSATLKYDRDDDRYYRYPYDSNIDSEEYNALAQLALSQMEIVMEQDVRDTHRSIGNSVLVKKIVPEVSSLLKKINTYTACQCAQDIEEFEKLPTHSIRNWHCVLD